MGPTNSLCLSFNFALSLVVQDKYQLRYIYFCRHTPFSNLLWVAMDTMHYHIAHTFFRTLSFRIQWVPMNNLEHMKNCRMRCITFSQTRQVFKKIKRTEHSLQLTSLTLILCVVRQTLQKEMLLKDMDRNW